MSSFGASELSTRKRAVKIERCQGHTGSREVAPSVKDVQRKKCQGERVPRADAVNGLPTRRSDVFYRNSLP